MGETAIEPGEINADDRVRLSVKRNLHELIEKFFKFRVILQHLDQSHHRMSRHIESQLCPGFGHARTARAKKSGLQVRVERLRIIRQC